MPSRIEALRERMLPARLREERAEQRRAAEAEAERRIRRERIEARRRALVESDAELRAVTVEGRAYYGRRVNHFRADEASAHNLALIGDALEHSAIPYFLVPGRSRTRHVIGMRLTDRKRLLETLRELYGSTALYAMEPGSDPMPADAVLYADGALPTSLKRRDAIRFGEILVGPADQILADLSYGCDVEFWRDGQKLLDDGERGAERIAALRSQAPTAVLAADALVAPRPNAVTDALPTEARIPASRTIEGRAYPTYTDLFQPRIDTVDFPIDVVYTWVDGADLELGARREAHRGRGSGASSIHPRETGVSRYTSHDELKYSLRSLEMYAPFIRNIHIVTDGQAPAWLNTDAPGIQVVDHKDIFSDPAVLPVFNSHAIETQLHHISGLSEHYLYLNDDVFLGRPVSAGHFFHGNGIAKLPFSPFQLGLGAPHGDDPAPNSAGKNVRALLRNTHARFTINKFMHTPHPQRRTVMEELEERFADDIARTSRSRFRSITDIAMTTSLHHHYAYLTGRAVPAKYRLRYIDVAGPNVTDALAELARSRSYDFFCLNDVNTPEAEQDRVTAELHTFLENYFPFPSRYER
ncbi:stealth family protein [Streptomyces botrytidirepellens]|uniref:Sugar phosphotransferase n=1 Tax=Streptomyces botrytidirepellens TaxID=2486417 RepID=A0A3M8W1G0_9ACTN|nr:stealth family protein [Streptomyces botrytidirepellens]RNG22325.1 sugar phosphotransferase [Streptomyces botrytidirepellens]